jgi:hypothetical protein
MASISSTVVAIAAIVATAASTATAAYSSVAAGENAKEVADYNSEMQRRAALDASQRGANDAADKKQETRRLIARQNAAMAGSGFDPNSGTNLGIMTETAGQGELDALKIKNNAQRQAAGLNAQSALTSSQGEAALSAGQMNGAGSGLAGFGNAGLAAYKVYSTPPSTPSPTVTPVK